MDKLQGSGHSAVSLSVTSFLFVSICVQCVRKCVRPGVHPLKAGRRRSRRGVKWSGSQLPEPGLGSARLGVRATGACQGPESLNC